MKAADSKRKRTVASRVRERPTLDAAAARRALLSHFDRHARALPWRETQDPYAIWVSEVMLQQTRVETVLRYYARFLERFPTVRALAASSEATVLAAWAGLGYYRRARLLHQGARAVALEHGGELPKDAASLRRIPGIGEYTAGAIASIAFGVRSPAVDGNVERVVCRLAGLRDDPRSARGRVRIRTLATALVQGLRPGDVNQALMDLGATVCKPTGADCANCPLRGMCVARERNAVDELPCKRPKSKPREEHWAAIVVRSPDRRRVWLAPSPSGRFVGMLIPPVERLSTRDDTPRVLRAVRNTSLLPAREVRHVLTHAVMNVRVYETVRSRPALPGRWYALADIANLALPRITSRILSSDP